MTRNKKLTVIMLFAACTCISIAATKPSAKQTPQDGFKNLKVLPKNISKDSLDMIMHGFNEALSVRCNFCHAGDPAKHQMDFASDEKPEKDIARYMMKMTYAINAQFFNSDSSTMPDTISVIKCITCHHGNPHPSEAANASNNMMPGAPGMPPPPPGQGMPPMDSNHKPMTDSIRHQQ